MSLLELLTAEKVSEFNESRGERLKVDLFAADLANKNLRSVDLSGADVDKADLTESDLTQAGLYKARLNGIDGTSMKLVDCQGIRVKLREAWLDQADLSGSDFSNGDLSEAVLTHTIGTGVRLSSAKLKAVDAKGARWVDADLVGANLSKADFTGADLSRADLTEAAGGEVIFNGVTLDGATGTSARLPGIQLQGASLVGATFQHANLAGADFTGANLTHADLTGANLAGAIFTDATLGGCVLADTSLEGVDLSGLDLAEVDLTGHDADLLELTDVQREAVVAIGIPINPDARLKPKAPDVARFGEQVVAVWENDDGAEMSTLRFAVHGPDGVQHGILPVSPASVLTRAVVSTRTGVQVVLLRERPGGVMVERYRIGPDGRLAGMDQGLLGYQPSVSPILRADGEGMRMWGIARRGPTLVLSGETEEGFQPVGSKALPTGRGFLGRYDPFLACKGNVLMPCTRTGTGNPMKSPDGYPGKLATAATDGDGWFVSWVEIPLGRDKGAICGAWLVRRGAPEVVRITQSGAVLSMDCCSHDGTIWLAWVEMHGVGETQAFVAAVPYELETGIKPKKLSVSDVDQVRFAVGVDQAPAIVLTTDEERIRFVSLQGKVLSTLHDG